MEPLLSKSLFLLNQTASYSPFITTGMSLFIHTVSQRKLFLTINLTRFMDYQIPVPIYLKKQTYNVGHM
jgi:hypothetical protein